MTITIDAINVARDRIFGDAPRTEISAYVRLVGLSEPTETRDGKPFTATWAVVSSTATIWADGEPGLRQAVSLFGDGEAGATFDGLRSDLADLCPIDWQDEPLDAYGEAMNAWAAPPATPSPERSIERGRDDAEEDSRREDEALS